MASQDKSLFSCESYDASLQQGGPYEHEFIEDEGIVAMDEDVDAAPGPSAAVSSTSDKILDFQGESSVVNDQSLSQRASCDIGIFRDFFLAAFSDGYHNVGILVPTTIFPLVKTVDCLVY